MIVDLLIFISTELIRSANRVCDTGCFTPSANLLTSKLSASSLRTLLRTTKSLKNILLYISFSHILFATTPTSSGKAFPACNILYFSKKEDRTKVKHTGIRLQYQVKIVRFHLPQPLIVKIDINDFIYTMTFAYQLLNALV